MRKNFINFIFFITILISLCFSNSGNAIQTDTSINNDQLHGINFQKIDSSICQNNSQIEIPTIENYPLAINFNANSIDAPFKDYFYNNLKQPPIVLIYFLAVFFIAIKSRQLVLNNSLEKFFNFIAIAASAGFILICLAWANLLLLNTKITEKEHINTYVEYSPYITSFYESFLSWVWQDSPALKINAYIISSGIEQALLSNDIETAVYYTDYDNSKETLVIREGVLLITSQHFYQNKQFQEASKFAEKALKLTNSDKAYQANQIMYSVFAMAKASEGKFDESKNILSKIDKGWKNDLLDKSWIAIVYFNLNALKSNKEQEFDYYKTTNILKSYLQLFSSYSNKTVPEKLNCLYASFLEKTGQMELDANKVENAIQNLEAVDSLISNQPLNNELLAKSYYQQGVYYSNHKDIKNAIISLEKAHNKSPTNTGINCTLSGLYMSDARDFSYFGHPKDAKKQIEKAKALCQFEGINDIAADISITNGQYYMRYGNWEQAIASFNEVDKQKTLNKFQKASILIQEARTAPNKIAKINDTKKWQKEIPKITGINCYFENDSNNCSILQIFDEERRIGMAFSNMSRVQFEENGKNIVLKDSDNNGQLDTSEMTEGVNRRVLVESDGDYRLDAELLFNEKGEKIDEKIYSGRALIHIPYAIIADQYPDFLSNPDPYLTLDLNGVRVGQTDIINNTRDPSWKQAFVQNYRKDDCIYITVWDYDSLDPDDRIDDFKTCDFSQSGILYGSNDKAAIQIRVQPTTLPEGVYDVRSVEKIKNLFTYVDFVKSDPKLQASIEEKNRAEEITNTMTTIATKAAPYLITPMLGINGITQKGLFGFVIGQFIDEGIEQVVEYQLKNHNVEKQSVNKIINE